MPNHPGHIMPAKQLDGINIHFVNRSPNRAPAQGMVGKKRVCLQCGIRGMVAIV